MTTQPRLFAVGRCIADIGIVIVTEQDIEACWRAQIADEIDAMPEVPDVVGPHEITSEIELLPNEEWREVQGYPNYQVSNMGRIASNLVPGRRTRATGCWRLLKASLNKQGYLRVALCTSQKKKTVTIHTLVLRAFVGPRPAKMECCHGNGIHTDNRLANLRWDTRKANVGDQIRHGKFARGEKQPNAKLTGTQVSQVKMLLAQKQLNHREIGQLFGVNRTVIEEISSGRTWKHIDAAAELESLQEGIEDDEWHSRGSW